MATEGLRRLHGPDWYQSGPGLVPVGAGLVIDFCTSPVRTGNTTYPRSYAPLERYSVLKYKVCLNIKLLGVSSQLSSTKHDGRIDAGVVNCC